MNRTTKTLVLSLLALALVVAAGCNVSKTSEKPKDQADPCAIDSAFQKAQVEANQKAVELQMEVQKRLQIIQLKTIDTCVANGGLPIVVGGNVDCRPGKLDSRPQRDVRGNTSVHQESHGPNSPNIALPRMGDSRAGK